MNSIGGYFELQLNRSNSFIHSDGVLVNTARNALEYILRSIGNIHLIYLPYYTCEAVLEPINKLGLKYKFYHINKELELAEEINLKDNEYIICNNYFGIKDKYIYDLYLRYGEKLIVDNAQALYAEPLDCAGTIYSYRKFVGVPDGGAAYCKNIIPINDTDQSFDRCSHLLKRIDLGANGGYNDFKIAEESLSNQPIKSMSRLTKSILLSLDYDMIRDNRKENYTYLRDSLESINLLKTPSAEEISCPMLYPFLTIDKSLRNKLINYKIYIAKYWSNVIDWCDSNDIEYNLTTNLLPLPIDQRYSIEEMERIINVIAYD